jgi:carbamoyl-phosphate synthase large subunit
MKKSILIFGGGINQIELIKEARKLEVNSIVIDPSDCATGKDEADFFYQVEGGDYVRTKQIALKHNVKGIVTAQMEKPLPIMAKLAQELGFVFNTPKVIERSLNKALMKAAFIENEIQCAKGVLFSENEEITLSKLKKLNFPMIVKPVDAFSSRGVIRVNNFNEILQVEKNSRHYSSNAKLLVEEFLEGREFSVECITFKGITTIVQITEKFITPPPNTVEMAHLQPARISDIEQSSIEKLVIKAINAIEINNSASHAEVMLTSNGPFMIEIGARLGGDFISSYLTKASTGVSMDKAAIQIALGMKPNLKKVYNHFSMIKYIELDAGKFVDKLYPLERLKKNKGYVFSSYFIDIGDLIPKITHSAERPVCILFKSNNYNKLFELIDKSITEIKCGIKLK